MIKKLIELGVFKDTNPQLIRYIRYTNAMALLIAFTHILTATMLAYFFGVTPMVKLMFGFAFVFLITPILSVNKWYIISRFYIIILAPIAVLTISLVLKINSNELVTSYSYFNARTVLMGSIIIPMFLFPGKRKRILFPGLALPLILIIFFDQINNFFGVGYENLIGTPDIGYGLSAFYYVATYLFLCAGLLLFKFSNENLIQKNLKLIDNLKSSNRELKDASDTIQDQSLALIQSNKQLTKLVDDRTIELRESNDELIKHNLELQQFSNTISHNLRGPVANLLGLAKLFELDKSEKSRAELVKHISSSALALNEVLKDLGKIIDIRNHLFQIKENVKFSDEFAKVKEMLAEQIKASEAHITTNFAVDKLYSIRSYLDSIMYNLLSNALKYSDRNRDIQIDVRSSIQKQNIILEFKDNGIGIDLDKYGQKLFGMYKRFHDHVEGKGLGLFLTKQQVESIGGKISVSSTPGKGTKFTIIIPEIKPEVISEQKFFESEAVTIWFDALNHVSTLVWKRVPTSDEYRDGLTKNLEIFRTYECDSCLADVRKLGIVSKEDRTWFVNNILSDGPELGLKKFIVVHDSDDGKDDAYFEEMRKAVEAHNIFFDHDSFTMKEAKHIVRNTIIS